jgi:tetratricopeptide (TPR) repeat protein
MDRLSTRRRALRRAALAALLVFAFAHGSRAQDSGHTLYGDLRVDESKAEGPKPLSFDVILYGENGNMITRQAVPNGGRYRFMNLGNGWYLLAVEVEGSEVARMRVQVISNFKNDFRQDIALEWRSRGPHPPSSVAADAYKRTPVNQRLFDLAEEALTAKKYVEAEALFQKLVEADEKDYTAWAELGASRVSHEDYEGAEKAYVRAAEVTTPPSRPPTSTPRDCAYCARTSTAQSRSSRRPPTYSCPRPT